MTPVSAFVLQHCLIACIYVYSNVHAKIIGGYVLPHGGLALDPKNFNTTNTTEILEAHLLHEACLKVGNDIRKADPDLVFLSTPHGLSDYKNFLIYSNAEASGYGDVDDCLTPPCRYNLSVSLEAEIAESVFRAFGGTRNVSTLSAFGPLGNDFEIPLRWGEVIPLIFVNSTADVVILSQPTRRYNESVAMIEELRKLGRGLFHLLDSLPNRVAVVISADLAHTHKADGPYGYSNTSQPFDDAIGAWASSRNPRWLYSVAAELVDRALSCGFTGLVMLQGMMEQLHVEQWASRVYANLHPSYYGMMAASFYRLT